MVFAQLYHESTGWNGTDCSGPVKLIPMCGSDSVIPLNARRGLDRQIEEARDKIKRLTTVKPNIKGFRILRSSSNRYSEGHHITGIICRDVRNYD